MTQGVKTYFSNVGTGAAEVGKQVAGQGPGAFPGVGKTFGKYFYNLLVSVDQFGNTLAGGSPDETVSSRIGRNYKGSFAYKFINWLFFWQKGKHCDEAIEPPDHSDDAVLK
jgi:hypothetical protein